MKKANPDLGNWHVGKMKSCRDGIVVCLSTRIKRKWNGCMEGEKLVDRKSEPK